MVDNTIDTEHKASFGKGGESQGGNQPTLFYTHSSKGKGMHKFSTAVVSLQKVNGICSLTGPSMATECELNLKLVLSLG